MGEEARPRFQLKDAGTRGSTVGGTPVGETQVQGAFVFRKS